MMKPCECTHPDHVRDVPAIHPYGATCSYRVRVEQGRLICGVCYQAGHGVHTVVYGRDFRVHDGA